MFFLDTEKLPSLLVVMDATQRSAIQSNATQRDPHNDISATQSKKVHSGASVFSLCVWVLDGYRGNKLMVFSVILYVYSTCIFVSCFPLKRISNLLGNLRNLLSTRNGDLFPPTFISFFISKLFFVLLEGFQLHVANLQSFCQVLRRGLQV